MPHDSKGKRLNVGDEVIITGVVRSLDSSENDCNAVVDVKNPNDKVDEAYRPAITCNSRLFTQIKDGGQKTEIDDGKANAAHQDPVSPTVKKADQPSPP